MAVEFRDLLDHLDESFTVQLIGQAIDMKEEDEPVEVVLARARAKGFDTAFIGRPRTDGKSYWVKSIVPVATGIPEALRPERLVAGTMPLSKAIGYLADPENDFALLLTGDRVTAVVTRADLDHMPVRMMLFAIIAHAEMLLNQAILLVYPDDSWIDLLGPGQRAKILRLQEQKRKDDAATLLIYCASLGQKCTVAEKTPLLLEMLEVSEKEFHEERKKFQGLRDKIFHHQPVAGDGDSRPEQVISFEEDPPEDILRDKLAHGDRLNVSRTGVNALDEAVEIIQRWIGCLSRGLSAKSGS